MKNTSVILSTYTADVSGVCSALYELGGMVVIHDPSGCNSTYNTHDEPRWYDQDSLIFISGLSEIDAIMGSDDKLIDDITRAAARLKPRFIALVRTPVPLMTGVDFEGIRDILAEETGLPVYYFPTSGMRSYIQGVNMALAAVARHMVAAPGQRPQENGQNTDKMKKTDKNRRVNLLGVTPLDFSVNTTLSSMKKLLSAHGFETLACLAMGSSPEEISRAGEADANLVVSSAGFDAACILNRRFGTPYVVGLPVGGFADYLMELLEESIIDRNNRIGWRSRNTGHEKRNATDCGNNVISTRPEIDGPEISYSGKRICLIGEAVAVRSLREALRLDRALETKAVCCLETPAPLMDEETVFLGSEEEVQEELATADVVAADPMYRPVCPEGVQFIDFPHEAFSGRIYRNIIPDLTKAGDIIYNDLSKKEKM